VKSQRGISLFKTDVAFLGVHGKQNTNFDSTKMFAALDDSSLIGAKDI
jgi:hypothetical protein